MQNDADYFVRCIGEGVANAFETCRLFLGIETETFENADIHPEYVTTVEVAKKLTGVDRYVSLETHMKHLRHQACRAARLKNLNKKDFWEEIPQILKGYRFGKKDSQRIDIVVRPSDEERPPLLLAEAKLGVGNAQGIIQDVNRVMQLLTMYQRLKLLENQNPIYGAVLFHSAKEGGDDTAANTAAQGLLTIVNAHISSLKKEYQWLYAKAGLLSAQARHQPAQGYWEQYSDAEGDGELVFAKTSSTFAPGLVLLSNMADAENANF